MRNATNHEKIDYGTKYNGQRWKQIMLIIYRSAARIFPNFSSGLSGLMQNKLIMRMNDQKVLLSEYVVEVVLNFLTKSLVIG